MSHKPRLLQLLRVLPWLEERLIETYDITRMPASAEAQKGLLAEHGGEFVGLVTSAAHGVGNELIDALPNVKVISSFGVGLDKLDVAYAVKRGIQVGYTPDVLNDCVADLAFGLMLDIARRLSEGDRYVRAGLWGGKPARPFPLGFRVSGAKLGIVGLGRIGSTIARRSTGFEMEVRYHSRKPVTAEPWTYEPSLVELASWCDFLVVITSGGPETRNLINSEVLQALGPQGFVINVSRGSVVDEVALLQALKDRRIAGAALDVFQNEPHVPEDFYALDNVVMVPHIASATLQTRQAMGQRVLDNLHAFFRGASLPSAAMLR